MCSGCSVLCDILVVTPGKTTVPSCTSLILCMHDFALQVPVDDVPGAPRGDVHHPQRGPLASHADPQQVSRPPAAEGNSQRFGLHPGQRISPLACPPPVVTAANCISSPAETPRTEVHCRPVPASSSLHHELYHHFSTFPECRQRDVLPTLLLKTTSDGTSHDWTDPVDINCFGTQVQPSISQIQILIMHILFV